jgi:exodeoxyribonuclease VII small subunit
VAPKKKSVDFEKTLQELEALVERLEQGDLPLEESLRQFERGIALTRVCQTALREAEQRVEILTSQGGQLMTKPFDLGGESDDNS